MNNLTTDKEGARLLVKILIDKGVRRVVLSPGSRNAPLTMAFVRETKIEHYVVVDERSAAFMALGMSQQSMEPVALVCTSGTAALNYASAIAEAYYQCLPLIVITADRPAEWIDQEDSQTIRQKDLYRNIIKASFQIPGNVEDREDRWFVEREVNNAVNLAVSGRKGPVHINVPLKEPLYGERQYNESHCRNIEYIQGDRSLSLSSAKSLAAEFNKYDKVMIVAGFGLPDEKTDMILEKFAELPQVVILSENPSNMLSGNISTIDRVLSTIKGSQQKKYSPDLLITFGGSLISRYLKHFLRDNPPVENWYIHRGELPADTFMSLTKHIDMDPFSFFSDILDNIEERHSYYTLMWNFKKYLALARHKEYIRKMQWSDLKAFSMIFPSLPENISLQLSNSTPVRYAQLFDLPRFKRIDCNRGTSGIDGCSSTAVGASVVNEGITLLITGDLGFAYDSNALWNNYISPRFKMIVMKNGGGGIFRFIPGPSNLEELDECFETRTDVNVKGFALLHDFAYFEAKNEKELDSALPRFFQEDDRAAILCVITPKEKNAEILRDYFKNLE